MFFLQDFNIPDDLSSIDFQLQSAHLVSISTTFHITTVPKSLAILLIIVIFFYKEKGLDFGFNELSVLDVFGIDELSIFGVMRNPEHLSVGITAVTVTDGL